MRPVPAAIDPTAFWFGAIALCLESALFLTALYRGLQRRMPIFTAYIGLIVFKEILGAWILFRFGFLSAAYFYFYWSAQAVLVPLRGLVVVELLRDVLRPFRGVWALGRIVLSFIGALLIVYAAAASLASLSRLGGFILAGERGLEFAVAGTLLALMLLCRYYGVGFDRLTAAVALGLGLYSCIAIVNNTVLNQFIIHYLPAWTIVRQLSYSASVLIWFLPLLQPLPAAQAAPVPAVRDVYRELAPQLSGRMRELNERLLDVLKQ